MGRPSVRALLARLEQSRDERCSFRRVDSSKSAFRRSPLAFAMRLAMDMDYASVALEQGGAVRQSTEEMSPGQAGTSSPSSTELRVPGSDSQTEETASSYGENEDYNAFWMQERPSGESPAPSSGAPALAAGSISDGLQPLAPVAPPQCTHSIPLCTSQRARVSQHKRTFRETLVVLCESLPGVPPCRAQGCTHCGASRNRSRGGVKASWGRPRGRGGHSCSHAR